MKSNLKKHELIGLFMMLLSGSLIGFGIYASVLAANRPLFFADWTNVISGKEYLLFPVLFGLGFVLFALAQIELKEALPGKRR